MIYFTSDLHFGHAKAIRYCKRPFASLEEMDRSLIDNWNSVVSKEDTVYVVGDFSFYNKAKTKAIVEQLNGTKVLILGNHDNHSRSWYTDIGFNIVYDQQFIRTFVDCYSIKISHYPYVTPRRRFRFFWRKIIGSVMSLVDNRYRNMLKSHEKTRSAWHSNSGEMLLLHGHHHPSGVARIVIRGKSISVNVSVDAWGFKPVLWQDVCKLVEDECIKRQSSRCIK